MAQTPPPEGDSDPARRWVGRASVSGSREHPAAGRVPMRSIPVAPTVSVPPERSTFRHRRRMSAAQVRRLALIVGLSLILIIGGLGLATYMWVRGVDAGLKRTDPFAAIAGRPAKVVDGSLNILLLGSDSRDPDAPTDAGGKWRTDTMVLMHIPASHDKAYLISFPRDLWVYVPQSADGQHGDTMAKLNAAYAWGGTPLVVQTLEGFTGVRMDHVVLIDFAGFVRVTDALGGVDMNVERTITSIHKPHRVFTKGLHHFSGVEALDYIRQRYQFPDGDFARMRHQQEFLKAIMDKAVSRGTMTSPLTIKNFVTSVADAITVDRDFSILDVAWQFHSLSGEDMVFLTSPYSRTDMINNESVVLVDEARSRALFEAVVNDKVAGWVNAGGSGKPGG